MSQNGAPMILDREGEAIRTTANERDLVAVIRNLGLQNIPPQNRRRAITEAVGRLVVHTTTDPRERMKPGFQQLACTYLAKTGIILPS